VLGHGPVLWRQDDEGLHVDLTGLRAGLPTPVLRIELKDAHPVQRFEPGFPD
jgi:hypothetical protein